MAPLKRIRGLLVIVGALAVVVLGLTLLSVVYQNNLQMETAEQFNRQQLLLARVQAANIQHYLDEVTVKVGNIARIMPQFQGLQGPDLTLLSNVLFDDTHKIKKRVEFLDGQGKPLLVKSSESFEAPDALELLSRVRESCSATVLAEADTENISIMAPVCSKQSVVGVVVVTMGIRELAEALLGPRKTGVQSYSWIMDDQGNLLYHPVKKDMTGRNLYRATPSCFECHKSFDLEKKLVESKADDFGRYMAPGGEDKIVSFSTVSVGKSRWIVTVSSPYSEVTGSVKASTRVYVLIVILGFLTTSIVAACLIVVNRKREQAEEQARRERTIEMMQADKLAALERLTSGIAREIGAPVTSIFSFIEVLMAVESDEFKRETIETIRFHMDSISDILQRLSNFSEQPTVEHAPCRINQLVESVLELLQFDKKVQNITIVRDLAIDLPETKTDKSGLAQVIVNIILRAVDAMPGGGTLTVRSRRDGDRVVLEFEDNGSVIPQDELDKIFDPLRFDRGEGLAGGGFSVSYGIIRRLGGEMGAESAPGKGTKFRASLPLT